MRLQQQLAKKSITRFTGPSEIAVGGELTYKLGWLYFASGIPALTYQTVWQRLLVLHSGVGSTSVAIIVAAYMLGMGLGYLCGGRVSRAVQPPTALACFAVLEVAIGICALLSPMILYNVLYQQFGWLYSNIGRACLLHIGTLLIPTSMMGATLPLMTRALVHDVRSAPRSVGILYGLNTLGAAFGAILAPWLLLPYFGVMGAVSAGAVLNFAVATIALLIRSRFPASPEPSAQRQKVADVPDRVPSAVKSSPFTLWMTLYFLGGLCAISLEIVWFRILDVALKSTSFTFGTVLAIYLACMAVGSIVGAYRVDRVAKPLRSFLWTQSLILIAAAMPLLGILYYPPTWPGVRWLLEFWASYDWNSQPGQRLGTTVVLYWIFPLFLMGPSTYLMGYSFCVLQRGVQRDAITSGYRVGLLQTANILGSASGSLVAGVWLLDAVGTLNTLRLIVVIGVVFAVVGMFATTSRREFVGGFAALLIMAWLLPEGTQLWRRLHGVTDSRAFIAEDITGVAALTPEPDQIQWRMSANGKGQSFLPFGGVHSKLGALPATLHFAPKSIAIIGLGSGDTAWAASCCPETTSVTVFEICTSEADVLRERAAIGDLPQLQRFVRDARIQIEGRDGRHALMAQAKTYDLIEADAIRPTGGYAGYLYSIEFFQLCAKRLNPGGLMCSWSPTPRTHVTFRQVFPHVIELDQSTVLIGSNRPIILDVAGWRERIRSRPVAEYLGPAVIQECLGSIEFARPLPTPTGVPSEWINTDLFPFDEFNP